MVTFSVLSTTSKSSNFSSNDVQCHEAFGQEGNAALDTREPSHSVFFVRNEKNTDLFVSANKNRLP